jgi:hypothetical protein
MAFDQISTCVTPQPDEIAVGTTIIFPQGKYVMPGGASGGLRYHQGIVTRVHRDSPDGPRFDGEHKLKPAEGKMQFRQYRDEFSGLGLGDVFLPPNAIDAVLAFN